MHTGDRESATNVYDIRIMRAWVFLLRRTAYTCHSQRDATYPRLISLCKLTFTHANVYTYYAYVRMYSAYNPEEGPYAVDTENLDSTRASECIASEWSLLLGATRSSDFSFSFTFNLFQKVPL